MIAAVLPVLKKPVRRLSRSRRFRYATGRARLLPSFLVIGTRPAGTASLFGALSRHPNVAPPTTAHERIGWSRELHFFDHNFSRGVNWYRSCFPLAARRFVGGRGGELISGEATSNYLFHPDVPARVAATLPDVRLIALLRDPIERARAHYESNRRMGLETLSFEEALDAESERAAGDSVAVITDPPFGGPSHGQYAYVARGLYADQLERWFAYFPPERFLVLRAEDFLAEPTEVYTEVLRFLGLRAWRPRTFPAVQWPPAGPIDPPLRARLEERFAEPNARLAELLGQEFGWSSAAPTDAGQAASRLGP